MGQRAQQDVDRLETPERVDLAVDLAGVGSRSLACLLDSVLVVTAFAALLLVLAGLASIMGASVFVLASLGGFLLQWFYFAAFEALWNGQTPGKKALGLRVLREGGYPVGWTEALIRNFLRIVDFLMLYAVGIVVMLLNGKNQRIGDMAAGTIVVRERSGGARELERIGYATPPRPGTGHASSPDLTAEAFETLHDFLHRKPQLEPAAGVRIETALAAGLRLLLEQRGGMREEWKQAPDAEFLVALDGAYREGLR